MPQHVHIQKPFIKHFDVTLTFYLCGDQSHGDHKKRLQLSHKKITVKSPVSKYL